LFHNQVHDLFVLCLLFLSFSPQGFSQFLVLKIFWNAVCSIQQQLGQVTILEQEKPTKTQTLPSDVMWQFLQWTHTVAPCCLLAYWPWNFPTNGKLAILAQHNPASIPTHPTQHLPFRQKPKLQKVQPSCK
jgi:hypothetical protein